MSGDARRGRAHRRVGVGRRPMSDAGAPTSPSASPTPASSATATCRGARRPRSRPRAAHRSRCDRRRRRPAREPARRRRAAGRRAAHHRRDGPGGLRPTRGSSWPGRWRRACSASAASTRPERRPPGGGRPRRAARLAGAPRHRPAPRERGPRARLRRSVRRGPRAARAGRRAGAGHERVGRLGLVRDGAGRDRPRHRPRRTRRSARFAEVAEVAPSGRPARRARLGPRRRGAGPPAARAVRRGGRGACAAPTRSATAPSRRPAATRERTRAWLDGVPGRPLDGPRSGSATPSAGPRRRDATSSSWRSSTISSASACRGGGRPARRCSPDASTVRWSAIHADHAGRSSERDVDAQRTSSTATRRSTRSGWRPRRRPSWPTCTAPGPSPGSATAAQQRAAELAEQVGGLRTPVLAAGPGRAAHAREREVALLAARGRSSAGSATTSGCRRGRSTPTSPGCTASSGSRPVRAGRRARRVTSVLRSRSVRRCPRLRSRSGWQPVEGSASSVDGHSGEAVHRTIHDSTPSTGQ